MTRLSFLDREHSIAPVGYNRWLVPPAALAIHLSVGQVYAFSVFNIPLTRQIGITRSLPEDWTLPQVSLLFSLAIVFLGLSAAVFGKWLERVGPRRAMFASALCFGGGFLVSAMGLTLHQLWIVALGYGVLGGIGLGLGYISPVSTLLKWFPDRPGMATGMAIMGFGGGAMIGSPLATTLMRAYKSSLSTGVIPTFITLGVLYMVFMMFGVFTVRLPRSDAPSTTQDPNPKPKTASLKGQVTADVAIRTPQFWLLWVALFVNVTAGIALLSQASPMIQEIFRPKVTEAAAAGFVGLLSLFNLVGRFLWSSLSDYVGRKRVYAIYFAFGTLLYLLLPSAGKSGSVTLFVAECALIMSMYGGGFATIPAYLRDMFGTLQVGAIHGRLLTAWSMAGICGPLLISQLREVQKRQGISPTEVYNTTLILLAMLLVVGFVSNLFVRGVDPKHYVSQDL